MYYFVTLIFILLSSKATFIDGMNICWFLIDGLFLWIALEKGRLLKSDIQLFLKFALIYLTFCTLRALFLIQLPLQYWVSDVIFLFKYVLPSFLFCVILREKSIKYLATVICHLAILSLPLYCLQLISGDTVYTFGKMLNLPYAHFNGYVNMIFFTYVKVHTIRNSGFAWEPGAFGFFLVIGLLLNFFTNNFTFDKKAIWMSIALITTLSTTAYIAFVLVLLLFFRARGVKFTKLLFLIVPVVIAFATSLPFLFDKIGVTYNRDMQDLKNIQTLNQTYIHMGQIMPLNRFGSMLFLINALRFNLIWGVSNIYEQSIPLLKNIGLSNGIFSFFGQFGMIGLGFLLFKSYSLFQKLNGNIEVSIYAILIILILGFGECIFITSIMLCFLFLYHYSLPASFIEQLPVDEDNLAKQKQITKSLIINSQII
ncbi:hypothetical protein JN11_01898 [Mucilaginibacter frigoritolerans]|uniref:O-antigen ligase-like membrane protein n=1 Tax=Mucilaginibacter frigoritolerans TaxID=652788 RepID=A0A562U492_9SPHI|nr:hypothetical protein JN11_01898 [Mucilaginibacter frigoritolerans]